MNRASFFAWLAVSLSWAPAASAELREFAAGPVTLPFTYSATPSNAPRPANLDFAATHGYPDNCQAVVRMDGELWQFQSRFGVSPSTPHARYSGPDLEHMTRREDASFPDGYKLAWVLGGLWYDELGKKLYAPMHIEAEGINRNGPVAPWPSRKIILATSTDKGRTWQDEGDIVSPETYFGISDTYKFAGSENSNGLCDFGFYADVRGGYFYLFPMEGWLTKGTWNCRWTTRAVRCAIGDKMAPGKWTFFYEGKWDQPALGGKSTVVAPRVWGVIYSTYLKRYVGVFPTNSDPLGKDNIDGVFLGTCSDLSKQDWQFIRLPEAQFGFMNVLNGDGTGLTDCDRSFRLYSYFNGNVYQRLDITLAEGTTTGPGIRPRYTFEGHPESSDAMLGRRTKFVGSRNADVTYGGTWSERLDPESYDRRMKESLSGGDVSLSFDGADIYWRALMSPSSGLADVYVDGALRKTVDCYAPQSTDREQIVYWLKGLPTNVGHSIKVVARGEKNPKATGTAISHIGFEFAAESYRASAGFSSIRGKSQWSYLEDMGKEKRALDFTERTGVLTNYWAAADGSRIGPNYQTAATHPVIRQWRAPHAGRIRIEGFASGDRPSSVRISKNEQEIWPATALRPNHPAAHDITAEVQPGDVINFVVAPANGPSQRDESVVDKVTWDPAITFGGSEQVRVWQENEPSDVNLARGKYARSKRLFHGYVPAAVVDGSIDTQFSFSEYDPLSNGAEWLSIDLNETQVIDRYVLLSVPANSGFRPTVFSVQKSDDGFAWIDVDQVTENRRDRIERAVEPFQARYVRFSFPKGKPLCISELELYRTAGKPAPVSTKGLELR